MDKLKKLLVLPVVYHIVVLAVMMYMNVTRNNAVTTAFLMDMCGVIVWPVFMALVSLMHAIIHEGKVYDYIYVCLINILIIGIARCGVYAFESMNILLVAAACFVVMLAIYVLWATLFAFTDRFMKKKPGKKNK